MSFPLLVPLFASAMAAAAAPGVWIVKGPDKLEALRPVTATIVASQAGKKLQGAANTALKLLPRTPAGVPQVGKGHQPREMRLMLANARLELAAGERVRFVFGDAKAFIWRYGSDTAAHPTDFALVLFESKERFRTAQLDENGMFTSPVRTDFTVEAVSETEFDVILPADLKPGEYGFVYTTGGPPKAGARVFAFTVK